MKPIFSFDGAPRPTGYPEFVDPAFTSKDDFWRTDAAWEKRQQLRREWDQGAVAHAEMIAAEEAQRKAAQREEAEAARAASAARLDAERARLDAECAEAETRQRIERAKMDARLDAMAAESAAKAQKRAMAIEASERQDPDFHAARVSVCFTIKGACVDGEDIYDEYDPSGWPLHEDEATNSDLIEKLKAETAAAMASWISHFASLGAIRADDIENSMLGEERAVLDAPCLYLVHRTDAADLEPARLGGFDEVVIDLKTVPGATLVLSSHTWPVNATLLYEATREGVAVGWCGGNETPNLAPTVGEERGDWLARVSVASELLSRMVERWADSGRNPILYRMYGDFTEREGGDVEIEWVVPNCMARGDVAVFAGDSGIGKSTIVHSWVAALGARGGTRPRTVLGQNIQGRFMAAIVSGEDSPGVISDRAKRHAKIWDRCTYIALNRATDGGLEDCLEKLMQLPVLDFVVFDPIRIFMEGSEQTSDGMNEFLIPIVNFARKKRCAVLLVHHLKKTGTPCRSLPRLGELLRGSNALIATARMTIGAFKNREGLTEIGPINYNYPEDKVWLPLLRSERYEFDPETATLIPLSEPKNAARPSLHVIENLPPVEERVWSAIASLNAAGSAVRRSGRSGLYEARLPGLAGVPRATILEAIEKVTSEGRLGEGPGGLRAICEASCSDADEL